MTKNGTFLGTNHKVNHFINSLGIHYPIIQAGMAGGTTTPDLVAAVSNAGALGTLGAGYMNAEQIHQAIKRIRELTDRPFAVNLFIPEPLDTDSHSIEKIKEHLRSYRKDLGLSADIQNIPEIQCFDEQIQAVYEDNVNILSFTFGLLPKKWHDKFKNRNSILMGTATTVEEAIELEKSGVNMIVGQGSEAGGHRGTFLGDHRKALIGTIALIPQIVDAVNVPVIAAGGIMDGRGMVAALALGASAVQMGSAFVVSEESGAHHKYKEVILNSREDQTEITIAFSGKAARGISNTFTQDFSAYPDSIPPYPIQNSLTTEIRRAAAQQNRTDYMSLWAGQAPRLSNHKSASAIIQDTLIQANNIFQDWNNLT